MATSSVRVVGVVFVTRLDVITELTAGNLEEIKVSIIFLFFNDVCGFGTYFSFSFGEATTNIAGIAFSIGVRSSQVVDSLDTSTAV